MTVLNHQRDPLVPTCRPEWRNDLENRRDSPMVQYADCPDCGADRGELCRRRTGQLTRDVHFSRRTEWGVGAGLWK